MSLKQYPIIFQIPEYHLTIQGWSRGSQNTGFFIPELKLLLDTQSRGNFDPEFILITHTHTDHCFSLPMRVTAINSNPLILAPRETLHFLLDFINATFRMGYCDEKFQYQGKLIGVLPEEIIPLKNNILTKAYNLDHNIPCRGYGLLSQKSKLKSQYASCAKEEIIKLKKDKVEITEIKEEFILAYLTDTTIKVFDVYPELLQYKYIMIECTFLPVNADKLQKEIELAQESKHTHWNFLYPIIQSHPQITFILIHFSHRYTDQELQQFKNNIQEKNIIFAI